MIRHVHGRYGTLNDNSFLLLQQQCQSSCHSSEIRRWETIKTYGILDEKPPEKNTSKSSSRRCRNINHINHEIKPIFKNHCLSDRKHSQRQCLAGTVTGYSDDQTNHTKRLTFCGQMHIWACSKSKCGSDNWLRHVRPSVRQRQLDTHHKYPCDN
jgi:hypothetical protein